MDRLVLWVIGAVVGGFALYAATVGILRVLDVFVYWIQQTNIVCPRCHRTLKELYFKCPNCNTVYTDLRPTLGNAFHFTCPCGYKLATTRIFGLSKYEGYCPYCKSLVGRDGGESEVLTFPIVGSAASGKTAFIMAAMPELEDGIPRRRRWKASFPFREDARFAADCKRRIESGIKPEKTHENVPAAFCVDYDARGLEESKRVFFYDPAGETFDKDKVNLAKQKYYGYMSGLIVIVDPVKLRYEMDSAFRWRCDQEGDNTEFTAADQDSCIENLIVSLDERVRNSRVDVDSIEPGVDVPVAVVLTKADAYDFDEYIGEEAIANFRAKYKKFNYLDAMDQVCVFHLRRWGGANLLNSLEHRFGNVRCFSVSAFGRSSERLGEDFRPERVVEPLDWLLRQAGVGVKNRFSKFGVLTILFFTVVLPLCWLVGYVYAHTR